MRLGRPLANVGICVLSLATTLTFAEGIARVLSAGQHATQYGTNYLMDGTPLGQNEWLHRFMVENPIPGVRHGFVPDSRWKSCYPMAHHAYFEPGGCVRYETGPHGYRHPEGLWRKPKGRCRILLIGDSVSFGWGVPSESLFSRHVERMLRVERPNLDVVNMGVIGYTASEGIAVLVHRGIERSPDVVVWQLHINDLIAMEGWAPTPVALHLPDSWRKNLRLISLIEHRLAITGHIRELDAKYGRRADPVVTDVRTEDFLRAIKWAASVLEHAHLPCIAMLYPYPDYLQGRYPFAGLHRLFDQQCREAGIVPLDLLPWLRRPTQRQLWVDQSDNHPSPVGHRLMAEALVHTLVASFGPRLEEIRPS